jgi:hypothetical protein
MYNTKLHYRSDAAENQELHSNLDNDDCEIIQLPSQIFSPGPGTDQERRRPPIKQKGAGRRPDPITVSQGETNAFARVERAVWKDAIGLSMAATGIYTFIAGLCFSGKSKGYVSLDTLRERFSTTKTTLLKYLGELEEWKLIKPERKKNKITGKYEVNRYRLLLRED